MRVLPNSVLTLQRLAQLLCVGLFMATSLPGQAQSPMAPAWKSLHFEAKKLFVRGEFSVSVIEVEAQETKTHLSSVPGQTALQPCQGLLRLDAQMKLMSNRARLQLWLEPTDLQMLQRSRFTQGGEQRLKTARFLDDGLWWTRREPDQKTKNKEPEQWLVARAKHIAFPALETNPYWLDPTSLLLLAGSPKLHKTGDQLTVPVFTDQQPYRVELKVAGEKRVAMEFRLRTAGDSQRVDEKVDVIKIDVRATALSETDDEPEFNVLGLTGDISIYMDAERGIPVMIEGDAGSRGHLKIRLTEAMLRPVARSEHVSQSCDRPANVIWR